MSKSNSITFAFVAETKGALRFAEIDAKGREVEMADARIGTLYFRKARFGELNAEWASNGTAPKTITITIQED